MRELKEGDRVIFTIGCGESVGRIVNLAEGMAKIQTVNGYTLSRKVSRLRLATEADLVNPKASEEVAPA